MTKLEELIQELCPDGVEFCPLEQCCNILDRKRKPVTKNWRKNDAAYDSLKESNKIRSGVE